MSVVHRQDNELLGKRVPDREQNLRPSEHIHAQPVEGRMTYAFTVVPDGSTA
jgi:hypothetical protein